MPFVVTVDQRASRRGPDRVAGALTALAGVRTLLGFERTAGDEFQGVLGDPVAVVDVVIWLVRAGGWSIGVGAGAVQTPLPESTRAATGAAFLGARQAVEAAKQRSSRLAVRGADEQAAADAQAVGTALAALVRRRSPQAWAAIDLVGSGRTQADAAQVLGVSRQAVGQRLAAASYDVEQELRPAWARMLDRAAVAR